MAILNYTRAYLLGIILCIVVSYFYDVPDIPMNRFCIIQSAVLSFTIFFPALFIRTNFSEKVNSFDLVLIVQFCTGFFLFYNNFSFMEFLLRWSLLGILLSALMIVLLRVENKTEECIKRSRYNQRGKENTCVWYYRQVKHDQQREENKSAEMIVQPSTYYKKFRVTMPEVPKPCIETVIDIESEDDSVQVSSGIRSLNQTLNSQPSMFHI